MDTEPLYLQANREILGEINVELTEDLYKEISLRQGRSVFDLAAERGVDAHQIERLKVARNARYADLIDAGVQVLDGVPEALERFSGRIPMGIVTSSNPEHFERIHQQTGLLPYFDFVLASGDYVRHKPHPEPYLTGAARHGCSPKRCLAIEDTERGLAAAVAAEMPCIVIPRPLSQAGNFATALHVLESARELPPRIDFAPLGRSHEPGVHLEIAVHAGMLIPNRLPLGVLGKGFEVGVSLFLAGPPNNPADIRLAVNRNLRVAPGKPRRARHRPSKSPTISKFALSQGTAFSSAQTLYSAKCSASIV